MQADALIIKDSLTFDASRSDPQSHSVYNSTFLTWYDTNDVHSMLVLFMADYEPT